MAQLFNACEYLLDRRLAAGDGQRIALTGPPGDLTYAELHDRVRRTAAGLRATGVQPEQRAADGDVGLAGLRGCLPRRDAGRCGAGPCLDDAARRRHRRTAQGLPGEVSRGHSRVCRRGGVGCRGGARTGRGTGGFPASRQYPAGAPAERARRRGARRRRVRHVAGLAGVLALHLGHHRHAEGRDAPARLRPGGLRDVRDPGTRHQARRPVPVGGQGLLRLRPGQLCAVPDVGGRGGGAEPGAVATGRHRRRRRQVRRDLVLRRPYLLRQHAARRARRRTPSRASGSRRRRARRCPRRSTSAGRHASGSTSSTASG